MSSCYCNLNAKPVLVALALALLFSPIAVGQQTGLGGSRASLGRNSHYLLSASMPPGIVAHSQVAGRRSGVGCFTAVSISGPPGLQVGLARDNQFLAPIETPVTTGMLVGAVYRFRVTNIPDWPGEELYPTLEIIDKTSPQPGREHRFPMPVVLTQEDLVLAIQGAMITRVIYLEDSEVARPIASLPGEQITTDVSSHANALRTADELGRPLAILRFGSRVPSDLTGDLCSFLYGCPPWVPLPVAPDKAKLIAEGKLAEVVPVERAEKIYSENPTENYPRIPQLNQ